MEQSSLPDKRWARGPRLLPGPLPLLTHLDQGLAGHGVPRIDHFPAGRVDQRAAESMLAVPDQAGLKLKRQAGGCAGAPLLLSLPPPGLRAPPYLFQVTRSQQRTNQPFNRGAGDLRSFLKALGRNQAVRTHKGYAANTKNVIQSSSVWLENPKLLTIKKHQSVTKRKEQSQSKPPNPGRGKGPAGQEGPALWQPRLEGFVENLETRTEPQRGWRTDANEHAAATGLTPSHRRAPGPWEGSVGAWPGRGVAGGWGVVGAGAWPAWRAWPGLGVAGMGAWSGPGRGGAELGSGSGSGCLRPPHVLQQLLALVVVHMEPGLELGRGDHQQRGTRLPQGRLRQGHRSR